MKKKWAKIKAYPTYQIFGIIMNKYLAKAVVKWLKEKGSKVKLKDFRI